MDSLIKKQLKQIEKQENKFLSKEKNTFIQSKINPIRQKIEGKIPEGLKTTLDAAFMKGFQLVFVKGNDYIEKTYKKDQMQLEHELNNYAVEKSLSKKYIKKLDKEANSSKRINSTLSVLEGGVLGVLGIGLPDIPLFISVIMRTIYQVSLSYGYDYEKDEEKQYVLLLICGAITYGEEQKEYNEQINVLGEKIDQKTSLGDDLKEYIKTTSDLLSNSLLTAKFIQGIPIVGVVGGAINYSMVSKIGKYASIKYKKRYLLSKIKP
ncbi:EcsC family protein [Alkalibaculum bacchi]|uniref:EcsC family protein n=1 Tax=Alkalibaculum bacchi TaxID=645887 RepID=A0A366I5Q2_9FIRM|nr:EcsC family protein [Alkalibaculum bacchi]RBP63792.1 EcsC family protein [Alkalibaculum bacchi]